MRACAVLLAPLVLLACTNVTVTQQTPVAIGAGGLAGGVASGPAPSPAALAAARRLAALRRIDAADLGPAPLFHHPYRGTVPMLGGTFALPEGEWTLLTFNRTVPRVGTPVAAAVFARREGDVLTGLFEIEGNRRPASPDTPLALNPICADTNVLRSDVRAAEPGGAEDCDVIAFQAPGRWRDSRNAFLRGIANGLDAAGIAAPAKLITAAIVEGDGSIAVYEQLWLNPDEAGIAPDTEPNPALSAWSPGRINRDPARVAYVDRLEAWVLRWRPVVRDALGHEQAAVADARTP